MAGSQLYSLTWGEFGSSLVSAVQTLRCHNDLVDVTLAAGGRSFPAHKIVLSAASPFLLDLLKSTPCRHPVLLLAGVSASDLEAILEFVYRGEVSVDPNQLPSLLQAAHCLNIQGLAPGALHPEVGMQGKIDEVTLLAVHQPPPRDANPFQPMAKRKKHRKRKNPDGTPSHGGKKRHRSRGDRDGMPGSDGTMGSVSDILMHNGEDPGSKIKGASDQPAVCPLCGATLRQARNLRRHLEMLHFGAGKIPPPDPDGGSTEGSGTGANHGHRSASRGSSSQQSVPNSPGTIGTPGSDQSVATVVVMPSSLCQPVMLASPDEAHHSSQQDGNQPRITPPNLACVLGPPLLPPPSVASTMMAHHPQHFIRYPGHPADLVTRADQQILRGVGLYSDGRFPRPDPAGGGGMGTEM